MLHGQWFANSIASLLGLKVFYLFAYANEFVTRANKKPRLNYVATGLCAQD
jgi:hypothetical protein